MQDYDSKLFTEEQIERALEENNIRAYFLEVDFKDLSREYNTGFQFAKGEVNSGFICFKLLYGESGIILKRGCTVYANIRKTTGETFKSNLSVLDYQNGIVLLSLSSQVLSIVGVDRLELAVIIDEEKTISPKIKYKVYESFDGDDKTDAENHPPLLDSEDLRLLITELRKEVEVNKVNIEDLTEKTGSNLKLIQSNTTKINSNTSEIEKIKQYNTNNDSKISNIENSIEENTNNISTNTNKIGELENKANTNESNISSNASKIELIEGEIETLKQYDSSNDTKISEIESKVDTNKSGIANNSSKIEQAISKIEENKTNISGNSSKISVLENKIPTIESKISGHTSKIEVIEGKIPTVESGILNNASKIDKLEKKIPTIETNISGNSSNMAKIEAKVESLETSVSGNSSSIEEVKGEVATIKSSISSNTSEVSKLKEKLSGMEPNVTSVVSKVEEIERQIPAIESRISGNTSNISTVKTKVEKNTSDITKISKRLDGLVVNPNVDLEEIVQARTATTGEEFNSLDERIDCEVDRLNKKIEVSMLQQEDKGSHVVENTVEGMSTDMVIKGRTLINIHPKSIYRFNAPSSEANKYTQDKSENSVIANITEEIASWCYVDCGAINRDMFKPNTKYTIIGEFNGIESVSLMDGTAQYSMTSQVAFNNNRAVVQIKSIEEINRIPNDIRIIIYCYNKKTVGTVSAKNVMILEGDWTNKTTPQYFEGIKSFGQEEGKISSLSRGKNLCEYLESGGMLENNFGDYNQNNYIRSNYINIEGLESLSRYLANHTDKVRPTGWYFYDNHKNAIKPVMYGEVARVPQGAKFVRVEFNSITPAEDISKYISELNFIVVESDKVERQYLEYKADKKDILLSEYGFDEGLRGLDNSVCDELNDIEDVAIKRIEKIVINDINISEIQDRPNAQNTNWFQTDYISNTTIKTGGLNINNKLIGVTEGQAWADSNDFECLAITGTSSGARIKGRVNKGVTSEQLKERLKGLIVYYELAEPVETPLGESINVKTFNERTYVSFENAISGTSSFKAPVNTVATISRLNRENRALEEENKTLRQDFESTTLSLTDSDLELVKQNVDMDFRLMEVEFALDIPQAILSSNINFKNKKGEVKSMARTPYEMMKIVILSGDYDREDYIHKVRKYYERGRMTKEEHDELMSLMTADEVISKKI